MTDKTMKRAISRTFDRTVCVYRPQSDGTEETVYIDLPCALSRSALVSAPATVGGSEVAEAGYPLALYTMPEYWLRLNDRVVIADATGRRYHARSSDSVRYPSHCVTVVEVLEVEVPVGQSGQDSGEACPSEEN